MDLILWRHCDAEAGEPDASRRLTPRGVHEAQRMAQWLAPRLPADCRILVSPAVRAQQTAQALNRPFETAQALAPGATVAMLLRAAQWPNADVPTMLVGHEPMLGRVAAYLLSGKESDRPIEKGGVVWLAHRPHAGGTAVLKLAIEPGTI